MTLRLCAVALLFLLAPAAGAADLGPTPVGVPPGPGYDWRPLPGIGWGWVDRRVPATAPPAADAAPVRYPVPLTLPPARANCPDGKCPLKK